MLRNLDTEDDVDTRNIIILSLFGCFLADDAFAGNSFVMSDGINRAPAVTLHCVGAGGSAVPCGVVSQPVIVAPVAGGSTASNQTAEIAVQQSLYQALGTQADPAYVNGAGSIVALLKGIFASGPGGNGTAGGNPVSRSLAAVGQQSVQLFVANPSRKYLAFQAPAGSYIWVNFIGGPAAPNGVDCAYFSAGTMYESGQFVNRGPVTVYSPVAATIAAWED
jgi:hypothetical protein